MSNIITATLSGNIVADPEIKYVGSDNDFAIVNLRLACNRDKKQADGSYESEASYFDLTVLGKFGELVNKKVRKGDPITVSARPEQQRWETPEGDKRSKVVFIVNDLDGAAMYRKAEDVPAKETPDGDRNGGTMPTKTTQTDDDIPF